MSGVRRDTESGQGGLGHWLVAAACAALLAGALPALASATDYCVKTSGCEATNTFDNFEQALGTADNAPDADRIFLGAGTYPSQSSSGFFYQGGPVEIIGQGEGQTVLTSPSGGKNLRVLHLWGGAGTSVHDLTIKLPQWAEAGASGLYTANTARGIEVIEAPPSPAYVRDGVELVGGGTLEDSTVKLGDDNYTTAVSLFAGGGAVRRSDLSAGTGFSAMGARSSARAWPALTTGSWCTTARLRFATASSGSRGSPAPASAC